MADTVYRVLLSLEATGSLTSKLGEATAKADDTQRKLERVSDASSRMGDTLARASSRMGDGLQSVADTAFDVSKKIAMIGGAATLGLATYGVVHLNQQLEQTEISLGAIFQAQGFTKTFEDGMSAAADQVAKMKQDVKTLPGDLGQLSDIMKMIATPAAAGGANADQIRQLAGKTMLTSTILGVGQDVASREMAGLLAGRAGSHNILGSRLGLIGDQAQAFNKASPEERLATINREMAKYQGAADRFGQSFVAQWTTLKDNIKYGMIAPATGGLFGGVKHSIAEANDYLDAHKQQVEAIVSLVNTRLVTGWDALEATFKRFAPVVGHLAEELLRMDPSAIGHKLERAGAGFAGMKLAGMALSGMGEGGLMASAPALMALAAAAIPAAGALDILTDSTSSYHAAAVEAAGEIQQHLEHAMRELGPAAEHAGAKARDLADSMGGKLLDALALAARVIDPLAGGLGQLEDKFGMVSDSIYLVLGPLGLLALAIEKLKDAKAQWNSDDMGGSAVQRGHILNLKPSVEDIYGLSAATKAAMAKTGGGGGGGGMNVQKVEIVVQGNSDPQRVAQLTVEQLNKLSRNPKSSSFVPNFQNARHGG